MSDRRMLSHLLEKAHRGNPWHGQSRRALIADVHAPAAAHKPPQGGHSIWELVLHMTAWTREVARRLRTGRAGNPAMGDWPEVGVTDESAWRAAHADLEVAHAELMAEVLGFPEERLSDPVEDDRPGEVGSVTFRETLIGVLQHDAYHCGQIGLLKRQAGLERPDAAQTRAAT